MLEFYKFVPQFGLRDASPFCLKLMTYLKLTGIPHKTIELMDPRKGPKQKLPYIVNKGVSIGDSEIIIQHLKQTHGDPLGEGMTDQQRAVAHAFNVMFAERFYWAGLVYPRWVLTDQRELMIETWFGEIPKLIRPMIVGKIFKDMKKVVESQGVGKHSTEEIFAMAISDLKAVEAQLGDQAFLLGDEIREIDATAYAFLANARCEIFQTPVYEFVKNSPTLMAYIDRVEAKAFG